MNMRFWLLALAEPKRIAAQVFTTSPMKVRTLGLMRERASQRTMVSSRTPQARPKAEVQDGLMAQASMYQEPALKARGLPTTPALTVQASCRGLFRFVVRRVVNRDQAQDFQFALAVGGDHHRLISHFLVEQRTADGARG